MLRVELFRFSLLCFGVNYNYSVAKKPSVNYIVTLLLHVGLVKAFKTCSVLGGK